MTAYRFRVKFDRDPTSLWRDVVVGRDRTLDEFQATVNSAVGLDSGHHWFFGADESYWNSDVIYRSPAEVAAAEGGGPGALGVDEFDAGASTVGDLVDRFGLEQYDRICYLYDYGDEWRFYAILKEVVGDEGDGKAPDVTKRKGESLDQYGRDRPGASSVSDAPDGDLPAPLDSLLPQTSVPAADLRGLEDREDVEHVLVIHSLETGFGAVADRFAIQFADAGFVLEHFGQNWLVVREVDGADSSSAELLADLADAARDWHEEIAQISSAFAGRQFADETIAAMDVELEAELERVREDVE